MLAPSNVSLVSPRSCKAEYVKLSINLWCGSIIAASAADVDLAMIMGTGFPPFRGGLLRFADTLHPRGIVDGLEQLADECGPRFTPAPTLVQLASEDRTLYTAFPDGRA